MPDFDIDSYRYLGECSEYCKEHYRPRGLHEPNCESDEIQALIDEIDRLNAIVQEFVGGERSGLSTVEEFGRADAEGNLVESYGFIIETRTPPVHKALKTMFWCIVPHKETPGYGTACISFDRDKALRSGAALVGIMADDD